MALGFKRPVLTPKARSLEPAELVKQYANSMQAYNDSFAPIDITSARMKFCREHNYPLTNLEKFWREHDEIVMTSVCNHTTVKHNDKFAKDTWSYDTDNNCIELSTSIWECKDPELSEYGFFAALSQAIQFHTYGMADKRFYWQLIFYSMGFNPRKELEAAKAQEAELIGAIGNGKLTAK